MPAMKPRRGLSPVAYLVVITALLATSGLVRAWQDHQMSVAAKDAEETPVELNQLPNHFGTWKAVGDDMKMDKKTLEIAGCSDYVTRMYRDARTGVIVTALVAYGPAEKIVGHTPAVCYPAVGYERVSGPTDRSIKAGDASALLRSFVFVKPDTLAAERVNVYAGFRHAGHWTPDSSDSRKRFRHEPGMFKIQVQRWIGPGERCDPGNPTEQFAAALISELERELAARRNSATHG